VLKIVLARPDDLHRPAMAFDVSTASVTKSGLTAPTEAAAEQRGVDGHFLERQARDLGGERLVAAGILRRTQTSQRSAFTLAVQFMGSMHACSRNGT